MFDGNWTSTSGQTTPSQSVTPQSVSPNPSSPAVEDDLRQNIPTPRDAPVEPSSLAKAIYQYLTNQSKSDTQATTDSHIKFIMSADWSDLTATDLTIMKQNKSFENAVQRIFEQNESHKNAIKQILDTEIFASLPDEVEALDLDTASLPVAGSTNTLSSCNMFSSLTTSSQAATTPSADPTSSSLGPPINSGAYHTNEQLKLLSTKVVEDATSDFITVPIEHIEGLPKPKCKFLRPSKASLAQVPSCDIFWDNRPGSLRKWIFKTQSIVHVPDDI